MRSKVVRFPLVGVLNTVLYGVATSFYIGTLGVGNELASLLGYLTSVPVAFVAHRSFTFGHSGAAGSALFRFVVVHLFGMLASWLSMKVAVGYLGFHYAVGIVATMVIVPALSFIVMTYWVFPSDAEPVPPT